MKFPLTFNQVQAVLENDFTVLDDETYSRLYEYYLPDMPYGTAKARDGDPDEWMFSTIEDTFIDMEEIEFNRIYRCS